MADEGKLSAYPAFSIGDLIAVGIGIFGGLLLFYGAFYSVHQDLAGGALSGRLAVTLGESFSNYSLYFPPVEKLWFTLAVSLSDISGLRLDLTTIMMTGIAVLISVSLAYYIRCQTVGASRWFLVISVAVLVIIPILFKNVFGLREHMVVLGLWPYLVLRISDHDDSQIGGKTRLVLSLWLGATLLFKYLFSIAVLLVEIADAIIRRQPTVLFRMENLISGGMVALYLFFWLAIDPSQREVVAAVVSAIDANLVDQQTNWQQAGVHLASSFLFVMLAFAFKLPARTTVIGFMMVAGAIVAAWVQARWYSHHLFPITMAYIAWLWMVHRDIKLLWIIAVTLVIARPVAGEFINSDSYQAAVEELDQAMGQSGQSIEGKRVGLLTMHPSPFNQHLASHGAVRWNASMNNSYVAAELQEFDRPENVGMTLPPVRLDDPGRQMLHDQMLRLWEDKPPELLILDQSTSWPLAHISVEWAQVFANDTRFQSVLEQYELAVDHKGERLEFRVYERID